jgi:NAD-dependent SIR2 family protein deacetylase
MGTLCPYCHIEVSESSIEAEDGCCPECGSAVTPASTIFDDVHDEDVDEDFDEFDEDFDESLDDIAEDITEKIADTDDFDGDDFDH